MLFFFKICKKAFGGAIASIGENPRPQLDATSPHPSTGSKNTGPRIHPKDAILPTAWSFYFISSLLAATFICKSIAWNTKSQSAIASVGETPRPQLDANERFVDWSRSTRKEKVWREFSKAQSEGKVWREGFKGRFEGEVWRQSLKRRFKRMASAVHWKNKCSNKPGLTWIVNG